MVDATVYEASLAEGLPGLAFTRAKTCPTRARTVRWSALPRVSNREFHRVRVVGGGVEDAGAAVAAAAEGSCRATLPFTRS